MSERRYGGYTHEQLQALVEHDVPKNQIEAADYYWSDTTIAILGDLLAALTDSERERERLREALRPFAEAGDVFVPEDSNDDSVWALTPDEALVGVEPLRFRVGDFRRAAATLSPTPTDRARPFQDIEDEYAQSSEKRYRDALELIDRTLRIPAAEYVPAIGDVFNIIDAALQTEGER